MHAGKAVLGARGQPPRQHPAQHQLHGDDHLAIHLAIHLAGLEHGRDVGMAHRGSGPGLAQEPPPPLLARDRLRAQQLERDLTAQREVTRRVHHAHAALPEQACELEAPERLARAIALRPGRRDVRHERDLTQEIADGRLLDRLPPLVIPRVHACG